jgi:hypothetical protein
MKIKHGAIGWALAVFSFILLIMVLFSVGTPTGPSTIFIGPEDTVIILNCPRPPGVKVMPNLTGVIQ